MSDEEDYDQSLQTTDDPSVGTFNKKPKKAKLAIKDVKIAIREMGLKDMKVTGIKATATVGRFLHEAGIMHFAGGLLAFVQDEAQSGIKMCDDYLAKPLDPESVVSIMKIRSAYVGSLIQTAQSHLDTAKITMAAKEVPDAPNTCFPPPPPSNIFNGPVQVIQEAKSHDKT